MVGFILQKIVHKRLKYSGGKLYWRIKEEVNGNDRTWNSRYAGIEAGNLSGKNKKCRRIYINKWRATAASMIWIYFFGDIPCGMVVAHKDADVLNNAVENLILVASLSDRHLIPIRLPNDKYAVKTSGVTFRKGGRDKPYEARVGYKGKRYTCGSWATEKEAANSIIGKRKELEDKRVILNHVTN